MSNHHHHALLTLAKQFVKSLGGETGEGYRTLKTAKISITIGIRFHWELDGCEKLYYQCINAIRW